MSGVAERAAPANHPDRSRAAQGPFGPAAFSGSCLPFWTQHDYPATPETQAIFKGKPRPRWPGQVLVGLFSTSFKTRFAPLPTALLSFTFTHSGGTAFVAFLFFLSTPSPPRLVRTLPDPPSDPCLHRWGTTTHVRVPFPLGRLQKRDLVHPSADCGFFVTPNVFFSHVHGLGS